MTSANYHKITAPASRSVRQLLVDATLFVWFIIIVDGVFPQGQMVLLNGRVMVPSFLVQWMLMGLLLLAWAIKPVSPPLNEVVVAIGAFMAYLVVDSAVLLTRPGVNLVPLLAGYNYYYAALPLIPLAYCQRRLNANLISTLIVAFFVPLAILGVAQSIFQIPFVFLRGADNSFEISSWSWFGRMRSFSLFGSGLIFGYYTALASCFIVARLLLGRRSKLWFAVLYLLSIVTCYGTLTRAAYEVMLAAGLSTAWIALSRRNSVWLRLAPVLTTLGGLVLVAVATSYGVSQTTQLASGDTMIVRYDAWRSSFNLWTDSGVASLFWGTGRVADLPSGSGETLLIDSTFLAVGLQTGVFGLLLWTFMMWKLWSRLLDAAMSTRSIFHIGMAGFWSTWALAGSLNISMSYYAWVFVISVFAEVGDRVRRRVPPRKPAAAFVGHPSALSLPVTSRDAPRAAGWQ